MSTEMGPILLTIGLVVIILVGVALATRGGRREKEGPFSTSTDWKASSAVFRPDEWREKSTQPTSHADAAEAEDASERKD
jgi:hypothetical protein